MSKKAAVIFMCFMAFFSLSCKKKSHLPHAMELISRGAPAYADSECVLGTPANFANNGAYAAPWRSCNPPSPKNPAWVALDLSAVPAQKKEKVLLAWYNGDTSPYDHTLITAIDSPGYNIPGAYTIEVNPAGGGAKPPENGWITAVTAGNNTYHSRQHVFSMKGHNWLRISVIEADGTKDNNKASFSVDVYDASGGTDDNWLFLGDSITQMSMHHKPMKGRVPSSTFAEFIADKKTGRFPVQENGGTGYMKSSDGAAHIEKWLSMFPGRYVTLNYGTNDAWSRVPPEEFYNNYRVMVEAVIKAGKTPLVPAIPWSSKIAEIQEHGAVLNERIKKIYKEYPQVVKGPDFWEMYKKNPELLSTDGVHPSWPEGLASYRKAWADLALEKVYK